MHRIALRLLAACLLVAAANSALAGRSASKPAPREPRGAAAPSADPTHEVTPPAAAAPATPRPPRSGAACPPDLYEEDDVTADAKPIALDTCQDRNHCDDDIDRLTADLTGGETYTFRVCEIGGWSSVYYDIYDPTMDYVTSGSGDSCPSSWADVVFDAPMTGTYHFELWGSEVGAMSDYQVCIDSGCTRLDDYEPDDDPSEAKPIAPGDRTDHEHCDDAVDWHTFDATAGWVYRFYTCWLGSEGDTIIRVYEPSMTLVGENDDGGDCDAKASELLLTATQTGPHYVEITQADGQGGANRDYRFHFNGCDGADPFEPDDDSSEATAIALGDCQDRNLCDDTDDWLAFDLTGGELYSLSACGTAWNVSPELTAYNGDLIELARSDRDYAACNRDSAWLSFRPAASGTHYLHVGHRWGGAPAEPDTDYQVCLTAGCIEPDAFEPDDTRSEATKLQLGWDQFHRHCEDPVDWVSFVAVPGQEYRLRTCNRGPLSDTFVRLYDPDGLLIAEDDDSGTCDARAAEVSFVATKVGLHTVEVTQADGGFDGDRDYSIEVEATCVTPDAYEDDDWYSDAKPIDPGECQQRTHCDDDSDWIALRAIAGETYVVETCNLGPSSDTFVTVQDPSRNDIAADDDSGTCDTLASRVEFTATQNGDHYVNVEQFDRRSGVDREYEICVRTVAPPGTILRNDTWTPGTDLGVLLPLDSIADRYQTLAPGDLDPDPNPFDTRPLILYQLDGPGTLTLGRDAGRIRLWF